MLRNSCRVSGLSRKQPSIRLVTRSAPGLWIPRVVIAVVRRLDDHGDALRFQDIVIVLAICAVSFSWICSRLA